MPRDPLNNPTERILRMIDEWMDHLEWLDSFDHPPMPATPALDEEILRQRMTKAHTESQAEFRIRLHHMQQRKQRIVMRQLGRQHGLSTQSRKGLQQGMEDQLKEAGEELLSEGLAPEPRTAPRLTKLQREIRDETLADLKRVEKYALVKEALKTGDYSILEGREPSAREVAEKKQAEEEERLAKAKSNLFGKPTEDKS